MAILRNFLLPSRNFLCRDQPMVIKTTAIILIRGCSRASRRAAGLAVTRFHPYEPLYGLKAIGRNEVKHQTYQQLDVADYQGEKADAEVPFEGEHPIACQAGQGVCHGDKKYRQRYVGQVGMDGLQNFHGSVLP